MIVVSVTTHVQEIRNHINELEIVTGNDILHIEYDKMVGGSRNIGDSIRIRLHSIRHDSTSYILTLNGYFLRRLPTRMAEICGADPRFEGHGFGREVL